MLKGWGLSAPAYHPHPAVWAAQAPPGPKGGPPPPLFLLSSSLGPDLGGCQPGLLLHHCGGGGSCQLAGQKQSP